MYTYLQSFRRGDIEHDNSNEIATLTHVREFGDYIVTSSPIMSFLYRRRAHTYRQAQEKSTN